MSRRREPKCVDPEVLALTKDGRESSMNDTLLAAYLQVHPVTLAEWKKKGRDGQDDYVDWYWVYVNSGAAVARELLQRIKKAGGTEKHWTANAWIMERQWGYVKPDPILGQLDEDEPPESAEDAVVKLSGLPTEMLEAALALAREKK